MNKEKSQKRRLYKQNARKVVRHHYFVLMMLCLVAIYFGAEYRYVTSQTNDTYNVLTGRNIDGTALSAWFWSFHSLQTWFTHIMFRTQAKELQTTKPGSKGRQGTVLCLFFYSGRHRTVPCLPCIII